VARDRAAAQKILDTLKAHGAPASFYLTEITQNDTLYYRVRMGFFSTREAATAAGKAVSDKAGSHADFRSSQPTEAEFRANGAKVVE
jgi:peptidoglycan/xylan/chitin deacetylase (PgdA/CDA1 family)